LNTARATYIKADSPEVKEVVEFAERFRYVLGLKINKLRTIMQKSDNHLEANMAMIRIQALEWISYDDDE
jgi:pantoate kinase